MAKGIGSILAHGGWSEEKTGIECDLDMDSITSGTAFKVNCPNISGGFFLNLTGAGASSVFSIDGSGNVIIGGTLSMSATDITVDDITADRISADNLSATSINPDVLQNGSALMAGQYLFDRERRYSEFFDDFLPTGPYSGSSLPWVLGQESGTTATVICMDNERHGVLRCTIGTDAFASAGLEHKNAFINMENAKQYWFEARVRCSKLYKNAHYVGLANPDLTLMGPISGTSSAPGSGAITDWIGFVNFTNSMKWHFVFGTQTATVLAKGSGSSTPNVATGVSGTYVRLGFTMETTGTTTATPYVNGVAGAAPTQQTSTTGTSYPYGTVLALWTGVSHADTTGCSIMLDYVKFVAER